MGGINDVIGERGGPCCVLSDIWGESKNGLLTF